MKSFSIDVPADTTARLMDCSKRCKRGQQLRRSTPGTMKFRRMPGGMLNGYVVDFGNRVVLQVTAPGRFGLEHSWKIGKKRGSATAERTTRCMRPASRSKYVPCS